MEGYRKSTILERVRDAHELIHMFGGQFNLVFKSLMNNIIFILKIGV